jgi:hypothetical protein
MLGVLGVPIGIALVMLIVDSLDRLGQRKKRRGDRAA